MNRIITLLIGLFFSTVLFSQQVRKDRVDYDNDSRWFIGLNAGATWSSADVKYKTAWGSGFTIGRSFNYNYGKTFSFDIRGRYLQGRWFGYNSDTTGFQVPNAALSSGATNYDSAYGYSALNFRTRIQRASLELVIHANELRAKTGLDLSIFGGIGYTWYQTYGDLINNQTGTIYRYDQLASYSKSSIKGIQDGQFDTPLNGTTKNKYSGAWMPSLGFGIGYQIGPLVSIGFEHKTTFTLMDNFDGYANPSGKHANDWYHYTSMHLRLHFRKAKTKDDSSLGKVTNYDHTQNPNPNPNPTTTQTQAPSNQPPIVHFTNPPVSGTTVSNPNYTIRASVQNVAGPNNIVFRQNGNYSTNFSFNPSTNQFEATVTLNPGQNTFELTGTNNYGSGQDQTVVIYNREERNPPIVTFVNPSSSPTTVQNPVFYMTATVLNVSQSNQVTVQLNGQSVPNFTFDPTSHLTASTLNLVVGTNIVTVTGTNTYGTDNKSTTIIYNPQQTEQPPVVYFVDPNVNPYTTTQTSFTIHADVLNVTGSQNITFKQNGTVNRNFTYNPATDDFQSTVALNAGQNVFEIIGTNTAGTANATTIIILEVPAPRPPIVTITNPAYSPTEVSSPSFTLLSTILNITQSSQAFVRMNGLPVTNFTYNPSTNGVSANLNLVLGTNTIVVTGTNADGKDSKQTTIIYRKQEVLLPPVVTFTTPSTDPFTTDQSNYTVVASVLNVTAQSGVNVNVNGSNVVNFTFNPANSQVTLPLNLIEGANIITITGTNTAGTDSEPQTIIFRKAQVAQPPVVSYIDPAINPFTVFAATYNVKARVRFVTGAQQIVLKINGQVSTNFTYSVSSELMTFTPLLVPGANIVEITATNTAGQDQESTTIIYRQPNPAVPPVVTITNPSEDPYTVAVNTAAITATVLNVATSKDIQVLINNNPFTGFTYNGSTKEVTLVMNLQEGANTIRITGTNVAGTAFDHATVIYQKAQVIVPPVVTFINPATPGTTVSNSGYIMKARVLNVETQGQITLAKDGQTISPALWSFNGATKEVIFNTTLNTGNNIFTVTGTNQGGSNNATTNILFRAPAPACVKPVITFTSPATGNTVVETAAFTVSAKIQHVTSANQVQLFVNGTLQSGGTYNAATQVFSKSVELAEAQNSLQLIAQNECETANGTTTITFKPKDAPCQPPVIHPIYPEADLTVQTATLTLKALYSNVVRSQVGFAFNGDYSAPYNFDETSHIMSANVALQVGTNEIFLQSNNQCGKTVTSYIITRTECEKPSIQLVSSTVPDNSETTGSAFDLLANVTGITADNQISVSQNGQSTGFVFTSQTGVLTFSHALVLGANTFKIVLTNNCGTESFTIKATRKEVERPVAPTIRITNPSGTPSQSSVATIRTDVVTTQVTSFNQVSVTINGNPTNFNFNAAAGTLSFNASLREGSNVITATAATPGGTATDTKTVLYTKPAVIEPPVIGLTNPAGSSAVYPAGEITISGTVVNVTSPNQVTIKYNGAIMRFSSNLRGNVLSFSLPVTVVSGSQNVSLEIDARNETASDRKVCLVSAKPEPKINTGINNGSVNSPTPTPTPTRPTGTTTPTTTPPVRPAGEPKLNPGALPGRP